MAKFYLNDNNKLIIGLEEIEKNDFYSVFLGSDRVKICSAVNNYEYYNGLITNLEFKNTSGDFISCTDKDDFLAKQKQIIIGGSAGISSSSEITTVLGYTPENVAKKGTANGYAPLDSSSKVPAVNLPSALAIGAIEQTESSSTDKAPSSNYLKKVRGIISNNSSERLFGYVEASLSTIASSIQGEWGIDFTGVFMAILKKIYVKPSSSSITINIWNKTTLTLVRSTSLTGLTTGSLNTVTLDDALYVDFSKEYITVTNVYYSMDSNALYTFTKVDKSNSFQGYLSYYFDFERVNFKTIGENSFTDKPNVLTGAKKSIYLSWNNGESASNVFSTAYYTQATSGLQLTQGQWNNFKNGYLSTQEHIFRLDVSSSSKFELRAANNNNQFGVIVDFSTNTITDKSTSTTKTIQSNLTSAITKAIVRYNYSSHYGGYIEILNEINSEFIRADLTNGNRIASPTLGLYAYTSDIVLKSYRCYYPYNDIDVLFIGDSITEGYGATINYVWNFAEYTGLKAATWAYAGVQINIGAEAVSTMCKFKPKVICATFGANGGNSIKKFLDLQNICDNYGVAFIANRIPNQSNNAVYLAQNQIIENFVNNYSKIKESARFDKATSLNADETSTYDSSVYADLIHPNDAGHLRMFRRMLVDCPFLFRI